MDDKIVPADTPLYQMISADGYPARDWTKDALSLPNLPFFAVATPFGCFDPNRLGCEIAERWRDRRNICKNGMPDKRTKAGRTLWAETLAFVETEWRAKAMEAR